MAARPQQWDITGQTVLVTGGTGGTGYQTARALAATGAQVVIAGRDPARGEDADAAIRRDSAGNRATFIPADHGRPQHVSQRPVATSRGACRG
jgi:NAD(P)-dependent dehydrogenase (short-subunit alcohol dehydrogenase family)